MYMDACTCTYIDITCRVVVILSIYTSTNVKAHTDLAAVWPTVKLSTSDIFPVKSSSTAQALVSSEISTLRDECTENNQ